MYPYDANRKNIQLPTGKVFQINLWIVIEDRCHRRMCIYLPPFPGVESYDAGHQNCETPGYILETKCASWKLLTGVLEDKDEMEAPKMERWAAKKKCSFRAKRRLITSSEIMKMDSDLNKDESTTRGGSSKPVEKSVTRESGRRTAGHCVDTPTRKAECGGKSEIVGRTSPLMKQTSKTFQDMSAPSSGYVSYNSSVSLRTFRKPKPSLEKEESSDLVSLRTQVTVLRNNFGVLRLLVSKLSCDLKSGGPSFPTATTDSPQMSPIACDGFSPELLEYGIRLAYLDILSPRQSVLVDNNWLRGIELVIVHLFRYGVVSETSIQFSTGVARCFKVLALIAAEIPKVTELIFKLLELIIRKKIPTARGAHRQYMAWQTSLLCRNCPRLALKLLKVLTSEFSSLLVSLHQNPENYAFHRSVTFFLSNLILDILLQLPKGCGHALRNIADDLRSIPTNAHLLSLAKQDIMDHVDFKLQPYTR